MKASAGPATPILMYHSVCEQTGSPSFAKYVVAPKELHRHLDALGAAGYRAVGLTELLAVDSGERCVGLTFDDGFADFYDRALPALEAHGATASLFVTTGYLGGRARWLEPEGETDRPMLDWAQLEAIDQSGLVEVGAHTHSHPPLDEIDAARRMAEIRLPRIILEDFLQHAISTFAYPFGYHDRRVRRLVAQAGYTLACEVGERTATAKDDRLSLPRWTVPAGLSNEELLRLVETPATRPAHTLSAAKRIVWREMRRYRPGYIPLPVAPPPLAKFAARFPATADVDPS